MSVQRRVQQQSGYILHHRPFRDSSQILDIVTRDHGRIAVVARGSRRARSRLAGVLRPFLPLRISWVAKSDLGTLTDAEAAGRPLGMSGDAMLSAYYVNELLLNLLHRHDPQPEVFSLYEQVLSALAGSIEIAASLRAFELELLGLLGYGLSLDDVESNRCYEYRDEVGVVPVERDEGPLVFAGEHLRGIAARRFDDADILRSANRLLRHVIAWHLGGRELRSRKVLSELHRVRIAGSEAGVPQSD